MTAPRPGTQTDATRTAILATAFGPRAGASLLVLLLTLLLTACGTFNVEGRLMRPAEITATAQAALTPPPTPAPRLGRIAFVQ